MHDQLFSNAHLQFQFCGEPLSEAPPHTPLGSDAPQTPAMEAKSREKFVRNRAQIEQAIPHRGAMLQVDQILEINLQEGWIIGYKQVCAEEPWVAGHFPGQPVFPGVLLVEALAQTAGVLMYELGHRKTSVLLTIDHAKFRSPVHLGASLYLHIRGLHIGQHGSHVEARALIENHTVACEATFRLAMVRQPL